MAVTFTRTPLSAFTGPRPAGQKLIYSLYDSASTPDRYVVVVYENTAFTGDGTEIAKLYITPNANNRAHFDLSDIAEGRVQAPVTNDSNGLGFGVTSGLDSASDGSFLKYTVKGGRYDAGTETISVTSVMYLHGGVFQTSDGIDPDFRDFYPTGSTRSWFLTDLTKVAVNPPTSDHIGEIMMADDDEAIVNAYSPLFLGVSTSLNRIRIRLYDDTGSLVHTQYTTVAYVGYPSMRSFFWILPLGPYNVSELFDTNWDTDWAYYDIDGVNSAATPAPQTKTIRVRRDCRPIKNEPVQIAFSNTLGGWDFLRFDGRNLKTISSETKTYRQTVGTYGQTAFRANPWSRGKTAYHVIGTETWELRNRSFSVQERDLLQYALRSKDVMYRIGTGDWLPCTINTNSYVVQPASAQLFDVSLQIELAQNIRC